MRETFSSLQTQTQNYCLNDTSAATLTFIKSELNRAQRFLFAELQNYLVQKTATATYVATQQYYHLPPDASQIESVTVTINGVIYSLQPVDSQKKWDEYNAVTFAGTAIPVFFFERKRDVGIWPIPQDSTSTITLTYTYILPDMTMNDYVTGTVTMTNNSQTVTGSGTAWTANMVGQWLTVAVNNSGDGNWYKVTAVASGTSLTIEEAYQGTTAAGLTYNMGQSPDLPVELHELLPFRTAQLYFLTQRKDPGLATFHNNMFWTGDPAGVNRDPESGGGLAGAKARYAKRGLSRVIHTNAYPKAIDAFGLQIWSTRVTSI